MSKIVQIQCIFYECKYQKFENVSKTMVEHTGLTEHSTRILKSEAPLHTCIWVSKIFHAEFVCFLLFLW